VIDLLDTRLADATKLQTQLKAGALEREGTSIATPFRLWSGRTIPSIMRPGRSVARVGAGRDARATRWDSPGRTVGLDPYARLPTAADYIITII
jgi:hypothetical protein